MTTQAEAMRAQMSATVAEARRSDVLSLRADQWVVFADSADTDGWVDLIPQRDALPETAVQARKADHVLALTAGDPVWAVLLLGQWTVLWTTNRRGL